MHLHIHIGIGAVHHMKNHITVARLLQGTFKGFDQVMRQFADKTDRIRQKNLLSALQLQPSGSRVQGGKQLVLCQNSRICKSV